MEDFPGKEEAGGVKNLRGRGKRGFGLCQQGRTDTIS